MEGIRNVQGTSNVVCPDLAARYMGVLKFKNTVSKTLHPVTVPLLPQFLFRYRLCVTLSGNSIDRETKQCNRARVLNSTHVYMVHRSLTRVSRIHSWRGQSLQ